jgi:4-hydroxy-4-methyl-2-oxoglutarate aldolase
MRFSTREDVISITPLNPFDRFDDGRPKVPDDLIERLKLATVEQVWSVLTKHCYNYQFEGNWLNLHPDRVLVGRAITATMVPLRPDLNDVVNTQGEYEGRHGSQNNWVIHTIGENDVVVVDLFGKVKYGTFVGDNLATAVSSQKGAGLVIDGGIRDTAGVYNLPNINVFCRGFDPTPIRDVTLISLNGPTRIGQAIVLPGDIVLGARTGVIFIPPHLVEEVVATSEDIRLHDEFGKQRLREGKYTSGQIDISVWENDIEADFQEWRNQRQS